eukprot:scaffold649623_cov47-Prasinocladus_malaysianus.AAC.1
MELSVANSGDNWYKARIGPWGDDSEENLWVEVPPHGGEAVVNGATSVSDSESTSGKVRSPALKS